MEITVTEADLRAVIQKQSAEIASKDLMIAAMGRTISEMEMANVTASEGQKSENGVGEHPGTEEVGAKPAPKRGNRSRKSG